VSAVAKAPANHDRLDALMLPASHHQARGKIRLQLMNADVTNPEECVVTP
jgi:hypothetical protein